MDMSGVM